MFASSLLAQFLSSLCSGNDDTHNTKFATHVPVYTMYSLRGRVNVNIKSCSQLPLKNVAFFFFANKRIDTDIQMRLKSKYSKKPIAVACLRI